MQFRNIGAKKLIISLFLSLLLSGCSQSSFVSQSLSNKSYPYSIEQAMAITYTVIESNFPNAEMSVIHSNNTGITAIVDSGLSRAELFISIKAEEKIDGHDRIRLSIPLEGVSGVMDTRKARKIEHLLLSAFNENPMPDDISVSAIEIAISSDTAEPATINSSPTESNDPFVLLERLKGLLDKGIISDDEYQKKKADLLKRI